MNCLERFLNYVKIHTTSDPNSNLHPSSAIQKDLGKYLVEEMKSIGITDAHMDSHSYIYGSIPANTTKKIPTIGFIAHLDTSSDISGKNVNPQIIADYDGNDVILNQKENIILSISEFPELAKRAHQTLITTDGLTLLGADDKAGICEIMAVCEYLINNKNIEHGLIRIAFTPDEEIGEGTMFFDLNEFKCDFAYTIDGGVEGTINYENFNACSCNVTINGVNIHPGSAKGHMINSILIAQEFNSMLPTFNIPANTELYEGFNHLNDISGNVEKTEMHYIIRNHNKDLFTKQKENFVSIKEYLNKKYFPNTCEVELKDSYFNMYDIIKDHMEVIEIAKKATLKSNVEPFISPIRGGTDGATLTYKGLICPNLGTGGANFHGRYEYITKEAMEKCAEIILNIINIISEVK